MASLRQKRVADQIKASLGSLFQGGQLNDPRLDLVMISAVKISPDLQVVTLYFRFIGEKRSVDEVYRGLASAEPFFKRKLAKEIELRRVPRLRYFYDEVVDQGNRIEELIMHL